MAFSQTGISTENLLRDGLKKYYGKYRGIVSNTDDPKFQGRIKAKVPKVLGDYDTNWAVPCSPFAGDGYGFQFLPNPGDGVWIEFEEGDPNKPIYTGFWWKPDSLPTGSGSNYSKDKRFIWLPGGLYIAFITENGKELIRIKHKKDTQIEMQPDGKMIIKSENEVEVVAPSIKLGGTTRMARQGDGVLVSGSGTTEPGGEFGHTHSFTIELSGNITGGSNKVRGG